MPKPVDNRKKPDVDLDEIEQARLEEEYKAQQIIDKANKEEESDDDQEEENDDSQEEENNEPPEPPKKPAVDYETKFKESQKEALILQEQLKQIEEEKNKKVEITEEYMKEKFSTWEDMTDGEKKALTRSEEIAQEVQVIKNTANQFNNDRKWQEKVDQYVVEEIPTAFTDIVGREEEFKRFATRPSRKGLPMDDLAKIFLFENPPPTPRKRNLFHAPGGVPPKPQPKPGVMSADDASELMRTRPSEYLKLIRAGKLKVKI